MLHARMVHPKTLGSTLISVGELDKSRFPNAQVIVKGNLVGVVAPTEWEAIRAAQQVAAATKWTDWKGLPGDANLFEPPQTSRLDNYQGHQERQKQGRRAVGHGGSRQEALGHLRVFVHEARAYRTDHGAGRRSSGRHGTHLHAQPESPGASRRNRADARHHDRSHRRADVCRSRPLWTIERRERGRGRRSGHPV